MTDNRRIVVAGNFWLGSAADGLTQGLRKLNWDICNVEMQNHFIQSSWKALRIASKAINRLSIASYNKAVLEAVETLQPRAFLTLKGSYLTSDTLGRIKSRSIKTLLYYTDFHFEHADVDQETFAFYDHIFTNNSFVGQFLEKRLGSERVSLLYFGYSPHIHYPRLRQVGQKDYVADCGYVGNCTPYKVRWLDAIVSNLPDVNLIIIGNGWTERARNTPLEKSIAGYQLVGDAYVRFIQQVRINIAFHMGPFGYQSWQDLVSMRTFEIPACKGFMLHIDNPEVRDLYEPGTEIDVFATSEDLCAKVRYYLARTELRHEMIEKAYKRCVPAYSYDVRAQAVARAIEGDPLTTSVVLPK